MSIIKDDAIWANMEYPATTFARNWAKTLGQDPAKVVDLLARDILEPTSDEESSLFAMSFHSDERGRRSSPNNYIRATLADPAKFPLTVQLNSFVSKLLFDESGKTPKAIGVEVMRGTNLYKADPNWDATKKPEKVEKIMAKREIIVSGGAFNSPQILKVSGIGPAAELKKFNIPVVKDLPGVGENLGDNYEASFVGVGKVPSGGTRVTSMFRTTNEPTKNRNLYAWCGAFSFEGVYPPWCKIVRVRVIPLLLSSYFSSSNITILARTRTTNQS
jgi:choline dehydrogenase